MLSSSQVQYIEEAIKAGKRVKMYSQSTVFKVEYPVGESPVLMMTDGLAISTDEVKPFQLFVGDYLSNLRPH